MAKLTQYFGSHDGTQKIYLAKFPVGSGSFTVFNDSEVGFAGSYQVFFTSGSVAIRIRLTDNNPAATSGSCEVTMNNKTDANATYAANAKLTITTELNDTPVDIYRSQGGTQIDGASGHNLWIGP